MGETSGDERHRAGPGERTAVDQTAEDETLKDEGDDEVGEAIRRAAEGAGTTSDGDAEGGEVGDAIERSTEEP